MSRLNSNVEPVQTIKEQGEPYSVRNEDLLEEVKFIAASLGYAALGAYTAKMLYGVTKEQFMKGELGISDTVIAATFIGASAAMAVGGAVVTAMEAPNLLEHVVPALKHE